MYFWETKLRNPKRRKGLSFKKIGDFIKKRMINIFSKLDIIEDINIQMKNRNEINILSRMIVDLLSLTKSKRKGIEEINKKLIVDYLFPQMLSGLNPKSMILNSEQIEERFIKMLITCSQVLQINKSGQIFNFMTQFLFVLKGDIRAVKMERKFRKLNLQNEQEKQKPKIKACYENVFDFKEFERITIALQEDEHTILIKGNEKSSKILRISEMDIEKFRSELTKEDYELKQEFLKTYLFCGEIIHFPLRNIIIEEYEKANEKILMDSDRIQLVLEGSVLCLIKNGNQLKYQSQLGKGSLLSSSLIKTILKMKEDQKGHNISYKSKKCKIMSLLVSEFVKILKNCDKITHKIVKKIEDLEGNRNNYIRRSEMIEEKNKIDLTPSITMNIGIVLRKSKAFRVKSQILDEELENFMSMNKYQTMTNSKENVERRLNYYSEIEEIHKNLRNHTIEQKNQKTKQRMKERKQKNIKNLRLKKTKIQTIAIKQSIKNTQKYRNRPQTVKFIFEDEVNEDESKENKRSIIRRSHKKNETMPEKQLSVIFSTKTMNQGSRRQIVGSERRKDQFYEIK